MTFSLGHEKSKPSLRCHIVSHCRCDAGERRESGRWRHASSPNSTILCRQPVADELSGRNGRFGQKPRLCDTARRRMRCPSFVERKVTLLSFVGGRNGQQMHQPLFYSLSADDFFWVFVCYCLLAFCLLVLSFSLGLEASCSLSSDMADMIPLDTKSIGSQIIFFQSIFMLFSLDAPFS